VEAAERIFVLARVPPGGPTSQSMLLFFVEGPNGGRLTPVFHSMAAAAAFLEQAQALGHRVPLDYVFPLTADRFGEELAGYTPVLEPTAADFLPILPDHQA
jgi:hypothetical protein